MRVMQPWRAAAVCKIVASGVVGSNPTTRTNSFFPMVPVAQLVSAPHCECGGCEIVPRRAPHVFQEPDGKAAVCKIAMSGSDSRLGLHWLGFGRPARTDARGIRLGRATSADMDPPAASAFWSDPYP